MATPSLLLLALVAAAATALYFLVGTASRNRTDGPACGHCGYPVYAAVTFVCPECGNDFREVGITVYRPFPFPARALLWTLAFVFCASFFHPFVNNFRPRVVSTTHSTAITSRIPVNSAPGYQLTARFTGESVRFLPGAIAPAKLVDVFFRGSNRNLRIDLAANTCQCTDPVSPVSGPFDRPTFRKWVVSGATDPTDPGLVPYADAAFTLLAAAAKQAAAADPITHASVAYSVPPDTRILTAQPSGPSTTARDHPLAAAVLTLFWAALWLTGLAYLHHRSRRTPAASAADAT